MPTNGMSDGRDVSIVMTINGGAFSLPPDAITSFKFTPEYANDVSDAMNGNINNAAYPRGGKGDIGITRLNSQVDDFFAAQDAAYYAGQNRTTGTITETIQEASGAVTQYRFTNVVFTFSDPGERKSATIIKMMMAFMYTKRLKVQ